MSGFAHLLPEHVAAFKRACRLHNVAILVRQTNAKSLRFIGKPFATPKAIDCKAKTADRPFTPRGGAKRDVAGLVVDPTVTGPEAFEPAKWPKVQEAWRAFQPLLPPGMGTFEEQAAQYEKNYRLPIGYQYFVERDPKDPWYGCVKFTGTTYIKAGKVIHGDFDLYAIIDMENPSANIRVEETMSGQPHSRSPKFKDVQMAINGSLGLGVAMVKHGAQETYASEHSDEGLDVFFPDGQAFSVANRQEIERLYAQRFGGRLLFSGHGAGAVHYGKYMRT